MLMGLVTSSSFFSFSETVFVSSVLSNSFTSNITYAGVWSYSEFAEFVIFAFLCAARVSMNI